MTRWQKSVTLKAIRENKVNGFDTGHIATPDDMVGKMEPFKPCWNAQYLNDGTQEFFDDIKDCQKWLREWDDIGQGDWATEISAHLNPPATTLLAVARISNR